MRLPAVSPPKSCIALPRIADHGPDVRQRTPNRGFNLAAHFGYEQHDADQCSDDHDRDERRAPRGIAAAARVDRRRRDRRGDQEERHLDCTAHTCAQHHGAAAGGHGHTLLVQVVELQRGAADPVRGDEIQEQARKLGQGRRHERKVGVDAAHECRGPGHRHERVEREGQNGVPPRGVLELALDRCPVDALQARDRDAQRHDHTDEDPDVRPVEATDLQRLDIVDTRHGREVRAECLEHLAQVLRTSAHLVPGARPAGRAG